MIDEEQNSVYFSCPWCEMVFAVQLSQLNCKIFRCGVYKDTFIPIEPHLSKEECDILAQSSRIYGCGKPFRYIDSPSPHVIKCDYI